MDKLTQAQRILLFDKIVDRMLDAIVESGGAIADISKAGDVADASPSTESMAGAEFARSMMDALDNARDMLGKQGWFGGPDSGFDHDWETLVAEAKLVDVPRSEPTFHERWRVVPTTPAPVAVATELSRAKPVAITIADAADPLSVTDDIAAVEHDWKLYLEWANSPDPPLTPQEEADLAHDVALVQSWFPDDFPQDSSQKPAGFDQDRTIFQQIVTDPGLPLSRKRDPSLPMDASVYAALVADELNTERGMMKFFSMATAELMLAFENMFDENSSGRILDAMQDVLYDAFYLTAARWVTSVNLDFERHRDDGDLPPINQDRAVREGFDRKNWADMLRSAKASSEIAAMSIGQVHPRQILVPFHTMLAEDYLGRLHKSGRGFDPNDEKTRFLSDSLNDAFFRTFERWMELQKAKTNPRTPVENDRSADFDR